MLYSKIKKKILWVFDRQWDYIYLKKCFVRNSKNKPEVIVLGSSYSIFGYEDDKVLNLALPSQDIYYALQIAKKCIEDNEKIKKIVLGIGYYTLNCDLSLTKSLDETNRIYDVYNPILNDFHNMKSENINKIYMQQKKRDLILSKVINVYLYIHSIEKYFNQTTHTRERRSLISGKTWHSIPKDEKECIAEIRVAAHEKTLNYKATLEENKQKLVEFKEMLGNSIFLCIFIAPMSEEYVSKMSLEYISASRETVQFLEKTADKFIDLNKKVFYKYVPQDFVDADHLNDYGARKMTKEINEWLKE